MQLYIYTLQLYQDADWEIILYGFRGLTLLRGQFFIILSILISFMLVQMPGPSPLQCFQETRIFNLVVKMWFGRRLYRFQNSQTLDFIKPLENKL